MNAISMSCKKNWGWRICNFLCYKNTKLIESNLINHPSTSQKNAQTIIPYCLRNAYAVIKALSYKASNNFWCIYKPISAWHWSSNCCLICCISRCWILCTCCTKIESVISLENTFLLYFENVSYLCQST